MANVLQVNFKYGMTTDEYRHAADALADPFGAVPGCKWKIWLLDEAAGGIYLFESKAAIDAMLSSELWAGVKTNPAIQDVSAKIWDVMEGPSLVDRAPIKEAVTA